MRKTFAESSPRDAGAGAGAASGDVLRRRRIVHLLVGTLVAAVLVVCAGLVAVAGAHDRTRSLAASFAPGPLARGHRAAGLACASCHSTATSDAPAASCTTCHAAELHRSSRAGHRALAARGALACTGCHAAHDHAAPGEPADTADVQLAGSEATVSRGDEGRTVTLAAPAPHVDLPLVPRAACARCHDVASVRDPAARCFSLGARAGFSTCFDEHATAPSYAVADAARRALDAAPDVLASTPRVTGARSLFAAPLAALAHPDAIAASVASLVGVLGLVVAGRAPGRRARRRSSAAPSLPSSATPPAAVPASSGASAVAIRRLPMIDASRCLGCRACVDACAFDVLEVERFVAQVVRPDACCGALTCELACPNGSLTLVESDASGDGGPRAHVDGTLESPDAPFVFLAGDLTGLPLIKNAIRQGRLVTDILAARLASAARERRGARAQDDVLDVIVVGAGPAGLSATLRARELGLSVVTLEQGAIGASIRAFPRGKLVFERPLELPLEGELWMQECTKEELIAQWERVVRVHRLPVRAGHRVTAVTAVTAIEPLAPGEAGRYRVTASPGDGLEPVVLSARSLILAVGTRGTPRPLPAPIDPAVQGAIAYSLVDAASFEGRRVLVVGLGDSAMEAALALARQPGCQVTLLARGERFTRGSSRTLAELNEAVAGGRVTLHFRATVTRVGEARTGEPVAEVDIAGTRARLPFDQMFVFIGGTGPWPLLAGAGVVVRGL